MFQNMPICSLGFLSTKPPRLWDGERWCEFLWLPLLGRQIPNLFFFVCFPFVCLFSLGIKLLISVPVNTFFNVSGKYRRTRRRLSKDLHCTSSFVVYTTLGLPILCSRRANPIFLGRAEAMQERRERKRAKESGEERWGKGRGNFGRHRHFIFIFFKNHPPALETFWKGNDQGSALGM